MANAVKKSAEQPDVVPGYGQLVRVFESPRSRVFKAVRSSDGRKVILKILHEDFLERNEIARYRNQYSILTEAKLSCSPEVLAYEKHHNAPMLVFADWDGQSLDAVLKTQPLTLLEAMDVAVKSAKALVEIHSKNIIHKDINPSNILYDRMRGDIRVIDFGISTRLLREQAESHTHGVTEGSLPYMSPEQTGRMNRFVDYRSDFYSFGVTLYQIFTGRLPFEADDPLRLIHFHIAKKPLAPANLNAQMPEILSDLILRLLSKNPEERYQSAWGVMADLQKIFKDLRDGQKVEKFPLGLQDVPDRFHIPELLYGRQREVETLTKAFERACDGEREFLFISGYPGVGKTSLIREIYKPVAAHNGHCVSGKFEPFGRSTPYSAFVDAFRELVRQLLGESETVLAHWRQQILKAMGPNGQIIIEVIPEVELIIGEQPPCPQLGPVESDNRFKLVFRNFVGVFCEADHPLVLHIDDMHWVDAASMQLIEMLAMDKRLKHFVFIGSYRDNEVIETHPLAIFLGNHKTGDLPLTSIQLESLDADEVAQLIADALHSNAERVRPLADLVLEKTGGNPFFTDEFLRMLHNERHLVFQPEKGSWEWDLGRIRSANMTDNVIELMSARIQRLSEPCRKLIELASCIGQVFDLATLAAVAELRGREAAMLLREAISPGLVVPIGEGYRLIELDIPLEGREEVVEYKFSHDRIQQAAYALIGEDSRLALHHRVGQVLLRLRRRTKTDDYLFAIVNHLNSSRAFLTSEAERRELIDLNLQAARKGKLTAAYQSSLGYLEAAMDLEKDGDWDEAHETLLALYQEAAEIAFLCRNYSSMQRSIDRVIAQGKSLIEKIPAYETRIHAAIARSDMQEAVSLGKKILWDLGVRLPENPSLLRIGASILWTRWTLRRRSVDELLDLPEMKDPLELARMHFLYAMTQPIFLFFPKQIPLITNRLVRNSLKHGNTSTSALAYTTYGMIMAAMLGDVKEGYRFGELGIRLYEKLGAKDIEAATLVCFNMFIRPWKDHVRQTLSPLLQAHQAGLDSGDFEFASHAALGYCNRSFFVGNELKPLADDMMRFTLVVEQLAHRGDEQQIRLLNQVVINLMEPRPMPFLLRGDTFDEERMLPVYERNRDSGGLFNTYFLKAYLAYQYDLHEEAVRFAREAEPHFKVVMGTLSGAVFYFIYGLALVRHFEKADRAERSRCARMIKTILARLKRWTRMAPMNFEHKYLLVKAEWFAARGKAYAAQKLYDDAIGASRNHQYLQDEALANELAARFHLKEGRHTAAYAYMKRARYNYERWGALGKVRALEETYPQMLSGANGADRPLTGSLATMSSSTIDITTLKRALLAIAEENVHSRMLEKIISSAIEFAGAQKGALLLRKEGEFYVEAESSVDHDQPTILQATAVEHSHSLSKMVVNFVKRSKRGLVIDNASVAQDILPGLSREPYIQRNKVKSILCIPITVGIGEEAQIIGLLYLENNRANNSFTPERTETLEIICLAAAGRLELSVKAATDGLTGLYNHDYFQSMLGQEMLQSQRQLRNLSLVLIDIDHFKKFNDQWGHQVGDRVLKEVAKTIRETCRKSDIVARYGGEEMAVILPETAPEMAAMVSERIRRAVENLQLPHEGQTLRVTISIGVSYLSGEVKEKDVLIRRADEALYMSKRDGRNRVTTA